MIDIEIRDKNQIVILSTPMKTPIRSRTGSAYFYNPMELLCVAVGSCFGKELVQHCKDEKINPKIFESIKITIENFTPKIIISHPKDMKEEQLKTISILARTCPIAKMLTKEVEIVFIKNNTPVEDLVDESKHTPCCGG